MNRIRFTVLAGMILSAAVSRLIPHPPNFTPLAAIALFGGAQFADRRTAFAVPLAGLVLSDCVLGFHWLSPVVYGAFALIVCLGILLRRRLSPAAIGGAALSSAVVFFILTNFAVWATGGLYPTTLAGLGHCYIAAIPFFRNTLAGDLVYSALLFGGMALAEKRFTTLRDAGQQAVV